ncbi:hypothetical protein V1527DRAFT_100347 [Lipomyces starkeyi]
MASQVIFRDFRHVLVDNQHNSNHYDIPEITTPARAFELSNSHYDWGYKTTFVKKLAWISKGQPLSEDIYSGKMEGLTHCVNTIYNGVRSSRSVFSTGKSNVTVLLTTIGKTNQLQRQHDYWRDGHSP